MDSWGQVVCEAMACGTPAIVSTHTGASDIIINGESGFVFDVSDKEKLKEQKIQENQEKPKKNKGNRINHKIY